MLVLSWTLITLAVVGSMVGLWAIAEGDLSDNLSRLIGVCAVGFGLGGFALGAAWVWHQRRMIRAMIIAIALGAAAWLVWSWIILEIGSRWGGNKELAFFLATCLTTAAVGLTYVGLFACLATKSIPLRLMKLATVVLAWLVGASFCMLTGIEAFWFLAWEWVMTLLAAIQVCTPLLVLGSIVTPLAIRSEARRRAAQHESVVARPKIKLDCPDCQSALECPSGPARCSECGLTMMIELEEPRCECGYLLFKLLGATCPECGREIAEGQLPRSRSDPAASKHAEFDSDPPPPEGGVRGG